MSLLGTLVNAGAILAGGGMGLLVRRGLPQRLSDAVMAGLGLVVLYIGIDGALEGQNALIATLSVVVGCIAGTLLDLNGRLDRFAHALERRITKNAAQGATFGEGFTTATLLFCTGAMAVVGALNSGLTGDHSLLFTKSLLDGISALVFASTLGAGVLLSAVAVLLYQGAITLLAALLAPLLSETVIAEMSCAGSILIIGIGLNLLRVTKLPIMNYTPAVFLPIVLCMLL